MNQDQANAIAESQPHAYDDALGDQTPVKGDMEGAALILNRAFSRGYAKCLMDLNPLIEAGERMKDEAERLIDAYDLKNTHLRIMINEWDTALSNLTKNIEP